MSGELYIVATPIGNLDDITYRAVRLLKEVDLIEAEDTRHSLKLLNHLGISNQLISLHDHNEIDRIDSILKALADGKNVALISDAGTPLISDPGYHLVNAVREKGYRVCAVPGASSVIAALSCAGLPTNEFLFVGFLSQKNQERLNKLESFKGLSHTIVLLESTHRIIRLLEQINECLPLTKVVVAKEMTKTYEKFISGSANECLAIFAESESLAKGEFVVMLHQKIEADNDQSNAEIDRTLQLLLNELPLKKAVAITVSLTGQKKNKVYQKALEMKIQN